MSLTDRIGAGLQAMAADVDRSQQEAAAVDHGIERIGARAVASGFVGIRVGLSRVREVLGQVRSLPAILPQGSRLRVWVTRDGGTTWWRRVYTGTGERITR